LAAAALEDVGPEAAIRQLDGIADRAERFQPYWATCAACLRRLGKLDDALSANATAVHLSDSEILQIWLERRAQSWRGALN
jgi:predicted RNA polymerase sigma factor